MAREIRKIRPDTHVGGLAHVFPEVYRPFPIERYLFERIKDLNPLRIKLCDAFGYDKLNI